MAKNKQNSVDISVAICTYNRSTTLAKVLNCLVKQVLPSHLSFEILVIDNASTDNTPELVSQFSRQFPVIRYIYEVNSGVAHARNRAFQEFAGDLLCFIDDDLIVSKNHLAQAYTFWKTNTWDIASGRVVADFRDPIPGWIRAIPPQMLNGPLGIYDRGKKDFVLCEDDDLVPPTCNMLISRAVVEKIGGFNTDLGRLRNVLRSGEDTEFCERSRRAGFRIGYCASLVARHFVSESRITRRYFLRWKFYGALTGSNDILPADTVFWLGVPRYSWRALFESLIRVPFALFTRRRMQALILLSGNLGAVVGYLTGRRRWTLAAKK
jgi:glucosyl-dolichyl phosphate glucuronosyltransferase